VNGAGAKRLTPAPGNVAPAGQVGSDEKPPIGGSWGRLYAVVLLFLALQILVYWLFTRAFA
jgi:hypothetical protein